MAGARLDAEWKGDDYGISMLFPFAVLSGEFSMVGEADGDGNVIEDQTEHEERFRVELPGWIQKIHDHYLAQRRTTMRPPQIQRQRKIGRNEPCPCGSGKKYKKCCGGVVHH